MSDIPPPPGWSPPGSPPPPPPPPPPSGFPPPPSGGYGAPPPGYTSTYGSSTPAQMEYAGIGARFGAALIDGVLVGLMAVPAVVAILAGPKRLTTCSVDGDGNIDFDGPDNAICEVPTGGTIAVAVLLGLVALVAAVLYYTLPVGRTGQTVGKRATGVRVVDAGSGLPIGPGRALGRWLFASFVSGNFCLLGYLWALWDRQKQTWHDKVVSSVVVRA